MNELILVFLGIFILALFIVLFVILYYINDKYLGYTNEINDNLEKSEQIINDTSKAFNKLQDNVINKIATVDNNQTTIIDNNNNTVLTLNSNLLTVLDIINNNVKLSNLAKSNIDTSQSLNINIKPDLTTYKNITTLTNNSQYINICDANVDPIKRKCLNINVNDDGVFNIYTANKVNTNSNIANIAIRDTTNNVMALFDGKTKTISLGSNITPAIMITDNIYTPDIIVCNYKYETSVPGEAGNPPTGSNRIVLTFITNFNIKAKSFINFMIPEQYIQTLGNNNKAEDNNTPVMFENLTLKIQPTINIDKNAITIFNIPVNYFQSPPGGSIDITRKYTTNGFITLS
jgi:hypothetical protein